MLGAYFRFITTDIELSLGIVPSRNAMAPPDLTTDAPILNPVQPIEIGFFPIFRNELNLASFDSSDGWSGQWRGFHIPLVGQKRFDHRMAAIAAWHHQLMRLDLFHQPLLFKIGNHTLAGFEAVQAAIGSGSVVVDLGIGSEDIDDRQLMTLANCVVVEIMRRRDFDATGAETRIDVFVGDDRDLAVGQGQRYMQADQPLITLIVRMHRHSGIAEHGFRASGGNDQITATLGQRIANVPHGPAFLGANHFQIRNGGV